MIPNYHKQLLNPQSLVLCFMSELTICYHKDSDLKSGLKNKKIREYIALFKTILFTLKD